MALLGWSLILASVVYIAIRRPPFVETLIALCCGSPKIQQPPTTRSLSREADADGAVEGSGRSSGVSLVRRDAPVRRAEARVGAETDRDPRPKTPASEAEAEEEEGVTVTVTAPVAIRKPVDTDIPTFAISSSPPPSPSPHTTPKAKASMSPAVNGSVPYFPLSSSTSVTTTTIDPPASAAAVARGAASPATPGAPKLSAPTSTIAPAMSMSMSMSMAPPPPPPRRPPKLNDPTPSTAPSLLSAPRAPPLPANRQAHFDRQPGTSTLAPPPTHSSKPSKPSRKVTLEPGHSPLDWARLASHPTADLRGLGAATPYLRVTPSMLRRQTGRRGKDAWTALGGRVYNISPYLPFHPGGEPELLRAAGRDGTRLFGEIHPWVNYETMLSSCLVGLLVDEAEGTSSGDMEAMD